MPSNLQPIRQLNLFVEHEWVDTRRVENILGVTNNTVHKMVASGLLETLKFGYLKKGRIRYASVVAYCDKLREIYHLPNLRPALSGPNLRHLDKDLLPFALSDTITVVEAIKTIGLQKDIVYDMIEEQRFHAYRLVEVAPWRISLSSLESYLARVRSVAPSTGVPPYKRFAR